MQFRLAAFAIVFQFLLTGLSFAREADQAGHLLDQAKTRAAVDARLAASWIASSYEVPDRVVEEMLYGGYSYSETLIAMAFMGEGASLNEVLEQRRLRGGARWREIANTLEVDADKLAKPVREILWFGRNTTTPEVIHYLPDPYPGIKPKLVLPAFEPTVPSLVTQKRFKLSSREIENIRMVLDDPLGVPEKDLLLPAGRGLVTADWVLAGAIAYFKPFPIESMIAARVGEDLPWSEVSLAFGLKPDVLTQGPLSGIYPVLSGHAANTVLIARKRATHPRTLPLRYDLERLTPGERKALEPLLHHHYQTTAQERIMLTDRELGLAEKSLALSLARMSELDLSIILADQKNLDSWSGIVTKYQIDMTGHPEVWNVIQHRDKSS